MKVKKRKKLVGVALSDSRNKTVKVLVSRIKKHPRYQKRYKQSKKYLVHTEIEIKKSQDVVIIPTRPISKRKSWIIDYGKN
ncbi:MAG: 30S ribosomal protein S17 [Patescibacteria group bacterium]